MPRDAPPIPHLDRLADEERTALVRTLIAQTGRRGERQVLLRYLVGGEEPESLAAELGLSPRRVHRGLHDARLRYQALLAARLADGGEMRRERHRGAAAGERDRLHEDIDDQALVERYPGDLSEEETDRFEAHFTACPRCRAALEVAADLRRQLRRVAAEDVAEVAMARAGVATWMARRGRHLGTGVALLALVLFGAGTIWYGSRLRHQEEQLTAARASGEEQRLAVEEERLEAARLAAELEQRDALWRSEREALLDRLAAPRITVDPTRTGATWSLAVDLAGAPDFPAYRLTVTSADGTVEHRRDGLRPGAADLLLLTFPVDLLPPGDHRLLVEGTGGGTGTAEVALLPFRIATGG